MTTEILRQKNGSLSPFFSSRGKHERSACADLASTNLLRAGLLTGMLLVSACASTGKTVKLPSENFNSRVSIIVIHHTSSNFEDSVNILTKSSSRPVSSHYLVPDPSDKTYTRKHLEVFSLVPETERAWHAGRSYWGGKSGLNDQSIGIEIVNQTYCVKAAENNGAGDGIAKGSQAAIEAPERLCFYPDFAENQMEVVVKLLRDILERHPEVRPVNIVGHSDIAPDRKIDPGPRFAWQRLYQLGIGAWFDDDTVVKYWKRFSQAPMPLVNVQKALHAYGYQIEPTGELDEHTRNVLRAFQMHFLPYRVTSEPSLQGTAILFALVEKYRPEKLDDLLQVDP